MLEMIEKSVLTAVGAMTLSQKKAEELVGELREKLNLSDSTISAAISSGPTTGVCTSRRRTVEA